MLSLLSKFWSRTIRTKAQLPWLSTRTTLFMCSLLLAHRRQTAKKKDHPNLIPVLESRWNNELRCIGFGWLRSPISINQESEDNIELLPLYHVPCVTLCTLSLSCQTTLTKRQKKKIVRCQCTTKLTQVSSFSESHTSHGRARHQIRDWLESGCSRELLTPGTSVSCRPRGVVTRDFFGHFWPSVWPSSRSNFYLGPSPLDSTEKKSFISELMILECRFLLTSSLRMWFPDILKCMLQFYYWDFVWLWNEKQKLVSTICNFFSLLVLCIIRGLDC